MARPRLTLFPYAPGDIDRFTPRADFAVEKAAVGWAWPDGPPPGRTWTLWDFQSAEPDPPLEPGQYGGDVKMVILGVGGVFDAPDGPLQAWAILSDLTPRQWAVAGQLAEEVLLGVERFMRPQAISATARASIKGAIPMLQKLGFAPEQLFVDPRIGREVLYQRMLRTG